MKIAIYSGTIPSTTFVEHLINGLGGNGIQVYLFGKVNKDYKPSFPSIRVFSTPNNNLLLFLFVIIQYFKLAIKDPKTFRKVPAILQHNKIKSPKDKVKFLGRALPILLNKPDIFHIQWVKALPDYYWLKVFFGIKIVVSLRGAHVNYSPLADKELANSFKEYFPKVDWFHGVSDAIVKEGAKYGLNSERSSVIRPAVQRHTLTTNIVERSQTEKLNILSVGRFHWKKGYHYALDAMKALKEKNVSFHYTIVAGGEHEEIIFQVKGLGLENDVTIVYGLPHKEVFAKMEQADLFLLPSVEEGIANVVLEAMATGTPVITTDCGGMAEVIQNEVNGFLVPVRDPLAIVQAVLTYKRLSGDDLLALRKNALDTILKNHLVENQIKAFEKLYKNALRPVSQCKS